MSLPGSVPHSTAAELRPAVAAGASRNRAGLGGHADRMRGPAPVGPRGRIGGDGSMTRHHRRMPLVSLLARLGWQRDPDLWTIPCRDEHGRRTRVLVHLTAAGVSITTPAAGALQLTPLQLGRLRAALRDAALSFDRLSGAERPSTPAASSRAQTTWSSPARPPVPPRRVLARTAARPSVAEIAARLTVSALSELEDDHDHSDSTPPRSGVVA
jgi:hypothetical protein